MTAGLVVDWDVNEVLRLLEFVRAAAPQQRWDEEAPAAWGMLLRGVSYEDAVEGVLGVLGRQPWVAPAEVAAEVRAVREARARTVKVPVPNVDPDDVPGYQRELQALVRAIRDGRMDKAGAAQYAATGRVLTGGRRAGRAGLPERDHRPLALPVLPSP